MFIKPTRRNLFALGGTCVLLLAGSAALAQWGNNAPLYNCGPCAPNSPWGYTPTRWTKWPYAELTNMAQPGGPVVEGITPPGIDLPPPRSESSPRIQYPRPGGEQAPMGGGETTEPKPDAMPPGDAADKPVDMIPPSEFPGAEPPGTTPMLPGANPTEPPAGAAPPSTEPSPSGSRSAPQIRNRDAGTDAVAQWTAAGSRQLPRIKLNPQSEISTTSVTVAPIQSETGTGKPALLRATNPDSEPELIIPSLRIRPLEPTAQTPNRLRQAADGELHADAVQPAVVSQQDETASDIQRTSGNMIPAPTGRVNPLRR